VIVQVPVATPVTIPDDAPTVAVDVLLLVHVPPLTELLKVLPLPTHEVDDPVIAPAGAFMVTVVLTGDPQPFE
jgi:hypothetical protein